MTDVRRSKEPVVFDRNASGWILRDSVDENSVPFKRVGRAVLSPLSTLPQSPNPIRTTSPKGLRPFSAGVVPPAPPAPAPPVSPVFVLLPGNEEQTATEKVLCAEIKRLEHELAASRAHAARAMRLLDGMCSVVSKEAGRKR